MALEKISEVYLYKGESSDLVDKLKDLGICLESFFNQVQIVKANLNTKIFFKDLHKANGNAAFDEKGDLRIGLIGPRIKMIYTYFDSDENEKTGFMLIDISGD
ncbi:MAG: hypothetical protein RSD71_16100 [Flavobacterium sp.]|uniref:hypothetical protein n=1 Tax=Flavobacterium sp. TaxID=239 RepID=UPI002FCA247D